MLILLNTRCIRRPGVSVEEWVYRCSSCGHVFVFYEPYVTPNMCPYCTDWMDAWDGDGAEDGAAEDERYRVQTDVNGLTSVIDAVHGSEAIARKLGWRFLVAGSIYSLAANIQAEAEFVDACNEFRSSS